MTASPTGVVELLALLRDGELGFQEVGEHLESAEFRDYFLQEARVRASYASQLRRLLGRSAEVPEQSEGSTLGAMHRTWVDVKAKLTHGDDALLHTTDWCEKYLLGAYAAILGQAELPGSLRHLLEEQQGHVLRGRDILKNFQERAVGSAPGHPR